MTAINLGETWLPVSKPVHKTLPLIIFQLLKLRMYSLTHIVIP